jgi:hypothetical protein
MIHSCASTGRAASSTKSGKTTDRTRMDFSFGECGGILPEVRRAHNFETEAQFFGHEGREGTKGTVSLSR